MQSLNRKVVCLVACTSLSTNKTLYLSTDPIALSKKKDRKGKVVPVHVMNI
jgi:hypothetical protein